MQRAAEPSYQHIRCEVPCLVSRVSARYNGTVHSHGQPNAAMKTILKLSLALTFLYILATFIFGLRAHSLALLSEPGHNVSDFLPLALSFFAVYLQARPATDERTFGYQRAGV